MRDQLHSFSSLFTLFIISSNIYDLYISGEDPQDMLHRIRASENKLDLDPGLRKKRSRIQPSLHLKKITLDYPA